jgi:hypothetical protein
MRRNETSFVSCYVYVEDAQRLLQDSGHCVEKAVTNSDQVPGHSITDFATSVAANLLAIYSELEELKITNRERFQGLYAKYLAMVEQYHAEKKDEIRQGMSEGQQFLLDQLFPREVSEG